MQERFRFSIKLCMIGNLLFVAFGLVCAIFYKTYEPRSALSGFLEFVAYLVEASGFGTLVFADYVIFTSVRDRNIMKISFSLYILLEGIMMFLELNSYKFEFYKPYSLLLAITHSTLSALVCLSFLQFEPDNKKYEPIIIACSAIIFCGMFGSIMHIRIYFSIIVNAAAFAILFYMTQRLLEKEELSVDCHGDRATVTEYPNSFFKD